MTTDRIEKQIHLKAPVSRVWRAISDVEQFSAWFGFRLEGAFVPGATIRGTFRGGMPSQATIDAAARRAGLEPAPIVAPPTDVFGTVERVEPERYLSYRWVPYGLDPTIDWKNEPTTLVEFTLEPAGAGTLLSVVESGFDAVPAARRERAFRMNTGGWQGQLENVRKYVEEPDAAATHR